MPICLIKFHSPTNINPPPAMPTIRPHNKHNDHKLYPDLEVAAFGQSSANKQHFRHRPAQIVIHLNQAASSTIAPNGALASASLPGLTYISSSVHFNHHRTQIRAMQLFLPNAKTRNCVGWCSIRTHSALNKSLCMERFQRNYFGRGVD